MNRGKAIFGKGVKGGTRKMLEPRGKKEGIREKDKVSSRILATKEEDLWPFRGFLQLSPKVTPWEGVRAGLSKGRKR